MVEREYIPSQDLNDRAGSTMGFEGGSPLLVDDPTCAFRGSISMYLTQYRKSVNLLEKERGLMVVIQASTIADFGWWNVHGIVPCVEIYMVGGDVYPAVDIVVR